MFNLPLSTQIKRILPKDKLGLNKKLALECESIIIVNEVTPQTVNLPLGDMNLGFIVLEVTFRTDKNRDEIITTLAKIPQNMIFSVVFAGDAEYMLRYNGKLYRNPVQPQANLTGSIAKVYEDLQAQIINLTVTENLKTAVDAANERQKLQRKITALEKKIKREKQFNIQMELENQLRQLKEQLKCLIN